MKIFAAFLAGVLLVFTLVAFLPVPEDMRYEALKLDTTRFRDVHRRIVENPRPIDVAFMGGSNTWLGVSDSEMESVLAASGTAVSVANLGTIWPGRDLNLFFVKQLLRYKKPRLLVLDIGDHEYAFGHPTLPYFAGLSDMFCCRFFIDPAFPKNLSMFLTRQALNSLQLFQHGWAKPSLAASADFGWNAVDRVWRAPPSPSANSMNLITQAKEAGYVATLAYGLDVIRQIVDLARGQDVDVAFLHLPQYTYSGRPPVVPLDAYTRLAPVLRIPDVLSKDPTLWSDRAHLNVRGAEILTKKLTGDVKMLLDHQRPADIWK